MPRRARIAPGGMVFHVLNRAVDRKILFESDTDYAAFEKVLTETLAVRPMCICGYSIMPNHWHMVLWPENDGDLAAFLHRLTVTHAVRWRKERGTTGNGHVYQNRYKSFPIETDESFYRVVRYVERNALRAELVPHAEDWRWSSLWRRDHGTAAGVLSDWPLEYPSDWLAYVNVPTEKEEEIEAIRRCACTGRPYGSDQWAALAAELLGLRETMRPRGRPRKGDRSLIKILL